MTRALLFAVVWQAPLLEAKLVKSNPLSPPLETWEGLSSSVEMIAQLKPQAVALQRTWSNTLQNIMVGIPGKMAKWLEAALEAKMETHAQATMHP